MRFARTLVPLLVALVAAPGFAYTVYLKDGSRLIAKEKYEIRGDKAILILPSGTPSMIDASEIDVERTEAANQSRLSGTAMVIEGGEAKELQDKKAKPVPKPRIQDLIRANEAGIREAPERPQPSAEPRAGATAGNRASPAPTRAPYPDAGVAADIRGFATARGVSSIGVYNSGRSRTPLVVFETDSEGSVFKALVVSANALLQLEAQNPASVEALEVVCETADGSLGGRFDLTPQLARELISGQYEITRFFVENVDF